eukprot:447407-Hanusia_phi.AAC.1
MKVEAPSVPSPPLYFSSFSSLLLVLVLAQPRILSLSKILFLCLDCFPPPPPPPPPRLPPFLRHPQWSQHGLLLSR